MKHLEVEIMGQSYRLGCPEGGENRLNEAVARVDGAMCKIRDNSKIRARDRIAVLAALNMAFDMADQVPTAASAVSASAASPPPAMPLMSGSNGHTNAQLQALIQRLDAALGADGVAA